MTLLAGTGSADTRERVQGAGGRAQTRRLAGLAGDPELLTPSPDNLA